MLSDNKDLVRLVLNRAKCLECGDIVTSHYRHQMVSCTCLSLQVDGGNSYAKRMFKDITRYEDMCVYSDAPWETLRKSIFRGSFGKKGNEPLHWVALRDMSDDHVISVIAYCEANQQLDFYEYYLKEKEYRGI